MGIDLTLFLHPSVGMGSFHLLAVMTNAALSTDTHTYLFKSSFPVLSGVYLGMQLLDRMVILCLMF